MQSPRAGWCTVQLLDSTILGSIWLNVTPDADSMVDRIDADCHRERWQYFRQRKCAFESLYLIVYQFGIKIIEADEGHLNNSVDGH